MTQAPDIRPKDWLMVATLGVTWGATFMVIEIALRGITPFWLASGRIGFAALLMTAIWAARGFRLFETRPDARALTGLLTVGFLSSAVPFILLSWGQQYVTSGFAGVSMAAVALLVLPLAHLFVPGETMTLRRTAGFGIGFLGVLVLIGGQAFDTTGLALEKAGRAACLGAACCYAVSSVTMRRLPPVDPFGLATILLIIGSFIVIPAAWIMEGPPPRPDSSTLLILALLGLVPTAGANVLRVLLIRSAGPTFMSLTNYLVPVCSILFGALILSEPLPPSLLTGLALILSGVFLSQWGALRRLFGAGN